VSTSLTVSQRTKARLEALAKGIEKVLSETPSAGMPATPSTLTGLLRAWRRLGRLTALPTLRRLELRQRFVAAICEVFGSLGFKPADFGAPDLKALAETFVTMLERIGYGQLRVSELAGRRSQMGGELLELLVQNLGELQKDFIGMAHGQRELLDAALHTLVDAKGTPVPGLQGKFGPALKATDIVIIDRTGKLPPRKFIDLAYVSEFQHASGGGEQLISFLVETEIKMPAASKKVGKQIGVAQVRFDFGPDDELHMVVAGYADPVVLKRPQQIIFAPHAINRTAVTVHHTPYFKPSFTARGGYPEVFWRVGVSMRSQEIWRLVDVALP
jgi:hypothetical protein